MSSHHLSRLVFGIATLVLFVGLLFSGFRTSAARPDRTPPTTPANLVATNVTATNVTLSWKASTDDSGKFSYKVRINNLNNSAYNSLATVSQSQPTYTAKFLPPKSSYTFAVYAVDEAGNQSSDSNLVKVITLADTTPPSAPVLQAVVLGPSQIQLTWTTSTDNVANHCCSYGVNVNGSPIAEHINWAVAPPGNLSAIIRHLKPSTIYMFSVSATDWSGGNVATSNTVTRTTDASNDTTPPTAPTSLHLVRDDSCAEVWLGWGEATDDTDTQDEVEYEIYVNGVLSPLPVSAGVDFDFVYGTAFGDNFFQVRAVDRSGNTSAPSNLLKLFLWPC